MARIGAPRIFFNVVGNFQAAKMLDDASAQMTVLNAIFMDGLGGIEDAAVALAEQMQAIVDATVPLSAEIERASLEFQKFLSVGEELSGQLTKEIIDIGTAVGFTAEQSLSAGARMAQLAGIFGDEVIPAATEMALAFGLIGDMAPEDAMIKLINLQQQTNFVFDQTSRASFDLLTTEQKRLQVEKEMATVINQLNSVEDKSAATMSKIIRVMNEFASQARLTGEEISFMAAMSATLIEAGEEQGKAGRALRMIYARLGADTNGAATALHNLGIATTDAQGGLRPLSSILDELAPKYDAMNSAQKQQIAQQVAGNLHYVRFIKLAEGFDRVLDLQQEALGETGAVFNEAGEATGFLADMMASNANQLSKARAELDLVNAAMGDRLIPHMVQATQFQTQYNQALLDTLDALGPIGIAFDNLFGFQQKLSTTYAPFFTMNLNLKAFMISLNTMRQITRAMDGEVMARNQESSSSHEKKMMHMRELDAQHNVRIMNLKDEKRAIEALNITENMAIGPKRKIKALSVEQSKFNDAFYTRQKLFKDNDIALTTKNITKLNLEDGVRDELQQSIDAQRMAMQNLQVATEARIAAIPELLMREQEAQLAAGENAIFLDTEATPAVKKFTDAKKKSTFALEEETIASTKNSFGMMKLGGALMLADMGVMAFSKQLDGLVGKGNSARISMVLTGLQMIVMMSETIVTGLAIEGLAMEQTKQAKVSMNKTVPANNAATGSIARMGGAAATAGKSLARMAPILIALGLVVYAVDKRFDLFGRKTKNTASELTHMNDELRKLEETGRKVQLSSAVDVSGMSDAAAEVEAFAGAREELFFGFKAGAVTGDLVKQVSMGGVENFVANTEVIMTNNFNGMTTEEVANVIIAEIESKGMANNIQMTMR